MAPQRRREPRDLRRAVSMLRQSQEARGLLTLFPQLPEALTVRRDTRCCSCGRTVMPRSSISTLGKEVAGRLDIEGAAVDFCEPEVEVMVGDAEEVARYVGLAQTGLNAFNLFRGVVGDDGVIAAAFDADGNRTSGDDRIAVQLHPQGKDGRAWFFSVEPVEDYVFERLPVVQSVIEQFGVEEGSSNPDSRFWRWVAPPVPGVIYGVTGPGAGPPNARVDFVVVGYRPGALVETFSPPT